jgi:hypothetical protein
MIMSNPQPRILARIGRLLLLTAVCSTMTGCSFVKDLAMIPVNVAETIVVETAKIPFKAAGLGVSATVDAVSGGVDALLAGK